MDLLHFIEGMRVALYQCGQVSRALQGQVTPEEKEPDSIHQTSTSISVVDRLCQEILFLNAYQLAPDLEVQSEEMDECPPGIFELFAYNKSKYALILDPVDGTGDYLHGKDTYAHMLGLLNQDTGRMDCSMIYFPEAERMYIGLRGMGAFMADGYWGALRPMQASAPPKTVEDVKRLDPSDYAIFTKLGFELVPPDSAAAAFELTRLAEGRLGAMVMRHFHGHDSAISSVIIEELGGVVLVKQGMTVTYRKEMERMPMVILSLCADYAHALASSL